MTSVLEALNAALRQALAQDGRVYLLGEDLLSPYGGAFKVTRGLSEQFPGRVLSTPISEAGFTGLAAGMALRGLRPVVEIMFGDFITLAADQLINHAAKFAWMYGGAAAMPLLLRTPMGGRRGYGPTHSQTLEKHFLGAPGLRLLAPCALGDPQALLREAILRGSQPALFIENKLLYLLPVLEAPALTEFELQSLPLAPGAQVHRLGIRAAPPPVLTLAAYGYMAELARQALERLAYEDELFAELIVPEQLAPFRLEAVIDSARSSGRLLTIEEGGLSLGWGAEVLAQTAQALGPRLKACGRIAALDLPVPASPALEQAVLPSVEQIIAAARRLVSA
jgi:pyruvate/2-oxoglutarate/acetoin dehydrogenase E1 component